MNGPQEAPIRFARLGSKGIGKVLQELQISGLPNMPVQPGIFATSSN